MTAAVTPGREREGALLALIDKVRLDWPLSKEDRISIVAALRLAAKPADEGWQPIESAPKDGTWILGWTLDDIDDGKWSRCSVVRWRTVGRTHWKGPGFYDDRIFHVPDLAYWRPLPTAPSTPGAPKP